MEVFIVAKALPMQQAHLCKNMVFSSEKKAEKAIRKICPHAKKSSFGGVTSFDCLGDDGFLYFVHKEEVQ